MALTLPKVYPITDRSISSLTHTEQTRRLLAGGATIIQLRGKTDSINTFFADAADALGLARASGAILIINDRVDIALALDADGVHLGQADLPVTTARRLLGQKAIIGYSTHNLDQVKAAMNLPIDYLAFGPIFPTRSKANPDPVAGLEALHEAKLIAANLPLVAIGGIGRPTIPQVLSAGADSAAVISEVLKDTENISQALRDLTLLAQGKPG